MFDPFYNSWAKECGTILLKNVGLFYEGNVVQFKSTSILHKTT